MDLLTYMLLQDIKKLEGGSFGDIKNLRKKVAQCQKNPNGDPLDTSCFVGFLEKVKNERGPFEPSLHRPDLAFGGIRIVSKK